MSNRRVSSFFSFHFAPILCFIPLMLFLFVPISMANDGNGTGQLEYGQHGPVAPKTTTERTFALSTDHENKEKQASNPGILLKEKPISPDEPLSAETLQALLSIGLYFNGTDNYGKPTAGTGGRKKQKFKSPELSCNAQEKSLCANARMCLHRENASDFECLCRKGYAGRFCQFSLFPRSCADALAFHEDGEPLPESGVWQLDMDGSAPLAATHAECLVDGAITLVGHNAPQEGFAVRSPQLRAKFNQSLFFPISYKLFSPAHLRALIDRSELCRQSIRFDCEQTPLDFKGNQTWLEIASKEGQQFRQIGLQPFSCACRNKELYGCGRDELSCYCDDPAEPSATDQAILQNKSAGVTAVFLRQNPALEGTQRLTLGPLECQGEAGTSQNALVTLRSLSARLETGAFHGWRQLELDFRTWQPDIEQMVSGWAPGGSGEVQLKISLRAGHRIELALSHQNEEEAEQEQDEEELEELEEEELHQLKAMQKRQPKLQRRQPEAIRRELSLSIASPRPLNDLAWHRLLVEMFRGEVRFSIDRLNAFQPLTFPFPAATRFVLGGDEQGNGFVGCVGNFRVDQRLVDWRSQLELRGEDVRVAGGCPELCQENVCEQGARCVEHFDTETSHCECRQPRIHFGENCEKNVNHNSSISLSGGAFLRFEDLPVSALHADLVFSVRTDQPRALFIYEHDQLDNFVQVHLADEFRLVLSLNNLSSVLTCTVQSGPGKVFNDMAWRQIVLEREAEGPGTIRMHVDEEHCQIGGVEGGGGPILLNGEGQRAALALASVEVEVEDVILPPVPLGTGQPSSARPFHFLFVGGLPRARRTKRAEKRLPLYVSAIPSLKGCIRGLLIDGEKLNLREAVENGTSLFGREGAAQVGCEGPAIGCERMKCRNGGTCGVDWHLPGKPVHCDCGMTSFGGTNCTEDVGLAFPGHSSLLFDLAHPKRFSFLGDSERQTLALAFAADPSAGHADSFQLAAIYFEDGDTEFHAILDGTNGTLAVGWLFQGRPVSVHRFEGNFTDGHRHFFRAHFSARRGGPLVSLDGIRHQMEGGKGTGMSLANAQLFYFGGKRHMEEGEEEQNMVDEPVEAYSSESRESSQQGKEPTTTAAEEEKPEEKHEEEEEELKQSEQPIPGNPESILMADAMSEIMAREVVTVEASLNGTEEDGKAKQNELEMDKDLGQAETGRQNPTKGEEADEEMPPKWPSRVRHFKGAISNVLITFEREQFTSPSRHSPPMASPILRFSPFLYYLQEEEFLHRSVRTVPVDLPEGGRLASASPGPFHVPEPAATAPRDVQFPVWEAPFHPVAYLNMDPSEAMDRDQRPSVEQKGKSDSETTSVWLLSLLLISLLILCLCCCCFRQRMGKGRRESAEFSSGEGGGGGHHGEAEKKPMLGKGKSSGNGEQQPKKKLNEEKQQQKQPFTVPIHLVLQRPLSSPPPLVSPVKIPRVEDFPEPANVKKQPKSILRAPGQQRKAATFGQGQSRMPGPNTTGQSESGTSSGGTFFTARDFFPSMDENGGEDGNGTEELSSGTCSFVSLEQPEPGKAEQDREAEELEEDDSLIGRDFEEQVPELMDESTLELSNGGDGLLHCSASSSSSLSSRSTSIRLPSAPLHNGPMVPHLPMASPSPLSAVGAGTPETLTASRAEEEEGEGEKHGGRGGEAERAVATSGQ